MERTLQLHQIGMVTVDELRVERNRLLKEGDHIWGRHQEQLAVGQTTGTFNLTHTDAELHDDISLQTGIEGFTFMVIRRWLDQHIRLDLVNTLERASRRLFQELKRYNTHCSALLERTGRALRT